MAAYYWNERYKYAQALPVATDQQRRRRYRELTALNRDFVAVASTYGRVLVADRFITAAGGHGKGVDPSFKEATVGGIAGGHKYIVKGVLFKLATGTALPYCRARSLSPDEAAAKAAGHDLRGATHFAKVGAVEVALMTVVDFRGFRIVAQALLPLANGPDGGADDSLKLGSRDALRYRSSGKRQPWG
eukprot:g1559.t1